MTEHYPILTNEDSVWLDVPEEAQWDIDRYAAQERLQAMAQKTPALIDLIEKLDCELVVETSHEYYPYDEKWESKVEPAAPNKK